MKREKESMSDYAFSELLTERMKKVGIYRGKENRREAFESFCIGNPIPVSASSSLPRFSHYMSYCDDDICETYRDKITKPEGFFRRLY